jgi:hypothetical protein
MKKVLWPCVILFAAYKKNISNLQQNSSTFSTISQASAAALQLIYSNSKYELTSAAVSKTGQMFINYPLWNHPHKYECVEIFLIPTIIHHLKKSHYVLSRKRTSV